MRRVLNVPKKISERIRTECLSFAPRSCRESRPPPARHMHVAFCRKCPAVVRELGGKIKTGGHFTGCRGEPPATLQPGCRRSKRCCRCARGPLRQPHAHGSRWCVVWRAARNTACSAHVSLTGRAEHQRLHVAGTGAWSPTTPTGCNKADCKKACTRGLEFTCLTDVDMP